MNFKNKIDKYKKILINKVSILLKSESYNSLNVKKNTDKYLNKFQSKFYNSISII